MLRDFQRALGDALQPEQRGAVLTSVALSLLLLAALWLGITLFLASERLLDIPWLDGAIALLGSVAAVALAWLLFPAMTMLVLGFFLNGVLRRVERRHYPDLPPARSVRFGEAVTSALRIVILAVAINLVLLPLYMFPPINFFIYYLLNGYLVGREYFDLVALRRLDGGGARAMWRWHRGRLVLAGAVMAILLSIPIVNLMAPVVAASFMLHVFEGLRRRMAIERFAS